MCKGACCEVTYFNAPLDEDHNRLMEYKSVFIDEENGRLFYRCGCKKLVNGLCTIYDSKPKICSEFAVGSVLCISCVNELRPKKAKAILALM